MLSRSQKRGDSHPLPLDDVEQIEHSIRVDIALIIRARRQLAEQEADQSRIESTKQWVLLCFGGGFLLLLFAGFGIATIRLIANPQPLPLFFLTAAGGGFLGRFLLEWIRSGHRAEETSVNERGST